ncbi:MAG: UDP-N-acetylmuramoyl-tripeptide--D-alanyl-D-alanine ligase [Saprospiraceae bacterium]|nr:UDP-N-acetylmuramoyl-tripeptide--D-alanyl-D-alanine ligase [Saprospiraceae bacterium]
MNQANRNLILNTFLELRKVSTDSRNIIPGSIFFALKGASFNGNTYAQEALKKGATFAVVDEEQYAIPENCILVKDGLTALQNLARDYRQRFHIPVIGLTGSNGKTTSKELIAKTLSKRYQTHFTKGNFNNHIGVPLTLLDLEEKHEVAVIEMGANHQKEIEFLCSIAQPSHGLITNIGKAHLEGFGGIEGVKKGKGELLDYLLENNGTFFYNIGDANLVELAAKINRKIGYGLKDSLQDDFYNIKLNSSAPFINIDLLDENYKIYNLRTNIQGKYNAENIAAAIAIGHYFKVSIDSILDAVGTYIPSDNRSQLVEYKGARIFKDAYNANPDSMLVSIQSFLKSLKGKKLLILGDMKELGDFSKKAHQDIVDLIRNLEAQCVLVGEEFGKVSLPKEMLHFEDVQATKSWFDLQDLNGLVILLKGSRGIGLERLLD